MPASELPNCSSAHVQHMGEGSVGLIVHNPPAAYALANVLARAPACTVFQKQPAACVPQASGGYAAASHWCGSCRPRCWWVGRGGSSSGHLHTGGKGCRACTVAAVKNTYRLTNAAPKDVKVTSRRGHSQGQQLLDGLLVGAVARRRRRRGCGGRRRRGSGRRSSGSRWVWCGG